MSKLLDRKVYNNILIHVAKTWERIRVTQPSQMVVCANIKPIEAIAIIVNSTDLIQEFIENLDGAIWNRFGDTNSDNYIERIATEIINKEYLGISK